MEDHKPTLKNIDKGVIWGTILFFILFIGHLYFMYGNWTFIVDLFKGDIILTVMYIFSFTLFILGWGTYVVLRKHL